MGGDLFPSGLIPTQSFDPGHTDFVSDVLIQEFRRLQDRLGADYPHVFLILGNDDERFEEASILAGATEGIWTYIHNRHISWQGYDIYGYAYIPPTPFMLKDWERYDVSRFVDPGCISPEEGWHTVPVSERELRYTTIAEDLKTLVKTDDLSRAIMLFHAPPYQTYLDRAALDGKQIDHVPLDVHVGSIAIQRFIMERQPRLTLHGHIHESARLTGHWCQQIGKTWCATAAHDGKELALVIFEADQPDKMTRELL